MFPLKNYKYEIPQGDDLGAFGVIRKHDVHTGVDLYCNKGDEVRTIEDGIIIAIKPFTGEIAGFPWWNDTYAIAVRGESGIINYGEIMPSVYVSVGDTIEEGTVIGTVIPVLKEDKGKYHQPPCYMLSFIMIMMVNGPNGHWIRHNQPI